MLKFDRRRKRAPIGGNALLHEPAWCDAGQMYVLVQCAVKRIARAMIPAWISSDSRRSGMIGNPAASAEVKPSGRIAIVVRSHFAPETADGCSTLLRFCRLNT